MFSLVEVIFLLSGSAKSICFLARGHEIFSNVPWQKTFSSSRVTPTARALILRFTMRKAGAIAAGATVQEILVGELDFNLNLQYGYRKSTELEPCLIDAQEKIKWADHLVIFYPVWWGAG